MLKIRLYLVATTQDLFFHGVHIIEGLGGNVKRNDILLHSVLAVFPSMISHSGSP